jgi:hypothetical protein
MIHVAKAAFEKYFLHKVRAGSTEPYYERVVIKILDIGKIKLPRGNAGVPAIYIGRWRSIQVRRALPATAPLWRANSRPPRRRIIVGIAWI